MLDRPTAAASRVATNNAARSAAQDSHPTSSRVGGESVPGIQVRSPSVAGIDLQIEGGAAPMASRFERRVEQDRADSLVAPLRQHVELLEPGGLAAVLERPRQRDVRDACCLGVLHREEKKAATLVSEHSVDRGEQRLPGNLDGML